MTTSIQVIKDPPHKLFNILNDLYQYDESDIKYIKKHLYITIKQDTYIRTVESMVNNGVISRGHRQAMVTLLKNVQSILQSANAKYFLIGDSLRDCIQFQDLLQTTTHVELGVIGSDFQLLKDFINLLSNNNDLVFITHSSNPDIIGVQFKRYQGIGYPFIVMYSYIKHDYYYMYSQNMNTAIDQSELFPLQEQYIDYLELPVPAKSIKYLRDQYPFFKHGIILTVYDKPVLILLKKAVTMNQDLYKCIKQQSVIKKQFKLRDKPRIQ